MKTKLTAVALSIALCCGLPLCQLVQAANNPIQNTVPTLKSTISQNTTQLELTLGKAQIIHLSIPASRVSISDPAVVSMVLISPTEVELIGKAIGVANLLVWGEHSGQNYLSVDLSVHRDVSTLASKIQMIDPGINILPVAAEDSVILTGVAESSEKAQLAYDLAKAFFSSDTSSGSGGNSSLGGGQGGMTSSDSPGSASLAVSSTKILNLIRVIGQPATKAEMIQAELKDIDPNIVLKVVPGFGGKEKALLSGRVKNASMVAKAVNLTSVFYGTPGIKILAGPGGNNVKEGNTIQPGTSFEAGTSGELIGNLSGNILHGSIITDTSGNVVSMMEVEERPEVRCSIKFLEVDKTKDVNLGISSMLTSKYVTGSTYAGTSGQSAVAGFLGQIAGSTTGQLGLRYDSQAASLINALITDGKAKVLAEPTITSISGEPASFMAGGEFPVVTSTTSGVSISFKDFGIRLNILSTVTDRGTIHMQVSPEVSSLDTTNGITLDGITIPGLKTTRSQTVLEMKSGDNFILSGLYNDSLTDTLSETPLLGQIPILGALFRSKAYQRQQTELIIVIHPVIENDMNMSNVMPEASQMKQSSNIAPIAPIQTTQLQKESENIISQNSGVTNPPITPAMATQALAKILPWGPPPNLQDNSSQKATADSK
jgi:Flp pilus assembly secretin CpaC